MVATVLAEHHTPDTDVERNKQPSALLLQHNAAAAAKLPSLCRTLSQHNKLDTG
jgi:hypothetical protein